MSAPAQIGFAAPRRVLVVDEEESELRALQRALQQQGWDLVTASSGESGLRAMEACAAQVVVCDFEMPGLSGLEFLRQIKERFPAAQRVLLAGLADREAIEEAINRGEAFRFVAKPWDDLQLQLTIAAAFEQHALHDENRRLLALTREQKETLAALADSLEEWGQERSALPARAKDGWELTFDAIEWPIAVLGPENRVIRANGAYAAMAGRAAGDLPGGRCHELLFARAEACPGCPVPSGSRASAAVELQRGERSFSMNVYFLAADGDLDRAVCVYRDTTEERLRTRRMLQAEKLGAVGRLAAGVAHQINNPLGGILAFTQLMSRDPGRSAADLESLHDIESAALRCKRIVESLLKLSRCSPAGWAVFDVTRAAEDAAVLFRSQLAGRAQVHFAQERSAAPLPVSGDANQIEQVILHLLVNALQALGERAGQVTLRTRRSGDRAEILIEDDGVGIAPEHLGRMFEPTLATKPSGEGTGAGLAISWNVAESHGGSLEVRSELGRGSVFTLRLPLSGAAQ